MLLYKEDIKMDMGTFFIIIKYHTLLARNVYQLYSIFIRGIHVFAPVLVINYPFIT